MDEEQAVAPQPSVRVVTAAARASEPSRIARFRRACGDFVRRVYKKAEQDQIFFLAGAIAFNVLVAIVPLALAAVGVAGFFMQARTDALQDPSKPIVNYLLEAVPNVGLEFEQFLSDTLNNIIASASGLFTIGTLVFAWLATRLIGTLRTVLREIFDIQQERSILIGKIFDLQMVFVAGTLLASNIAITATAQLIAVRGAGYLDIAMGEQSLALDLLLRGLAFFTIWSMFALIYRYLPIRRIQWRTALIAATFTAFTFELMKAGFGWYFANYATYRTYGILANLAIVVIWVYYAAIAFILGGEVGQVASLQRIRRQQKERLS
ncbi:MAG TPA: YihY/virulence factor BrkB family protein [Longimicrobiales bacterium]|nr:YihY/virulence factor BrkB family protein [Longimicrobiales bacterium]